MGRIIAYATPVFFAMIAIEYFVGRARGRNKYRLNDAVNSLSLGVMSQVIGLFTRALTIGIYAVVYSAVAVRQLPADQWWVWLLGMVSYKLGRSIAWDGVKEIIPGDAAANELLSRKYRGPWQYPTI